jgi:hypothetical protein
VEAALPALRRLVEEERDPYIAVAALRSAIAIAGSEELQGCLQRLAGQRFVHGASVGAAGLDRLAALAAAPTRGG